MELERERESEREKEKKEEVIDLGKQVETFQEKTGKDFTEFYNKYLPKLIYFANKFCKDEDEAKDYAEESFIIGLNKIDTYDNEKAGFSTWLFTVARNHIFQTLKKKKRMPTLSMDTKIDEEGTTIKDFISGDDMEDQLIKEKRDIDIKKAEIMMESIETLKKPYKNVIKMREVKNMSYRDIASELGKDDTLTIIINDENTKIDEDGEVVYQKIELPNPVSSIDSIVGDGGEKIEGIEFVLYEGDTKKTPFFTHIKIKQKGKFYLKCRVPKNLSTVKSQIRNGRIKLQDMVEDRFKRLDEMYL